MLEDLLADELSLAGRETIGGQPDACGGAQRRATNGLQLRGFVAARGRFGAVWPSSSGLSKQYRRPAFPGRVHVLRLAQIEQVALGRKDGAIAAPDGGADIFRLAGFLCDDDLIGHGKPSGSIPRRRG